MQLIANFYFLNNLDFLPYKDKNSQDKRKKSLEKRLRKNEGKSAERSKNIKKLFPIFFYKL